MKTVMICIAGFVFLFIGFTFYCCLVVGARADRDLEEIYIRQHTDKNGQDDR